MLWTCGALLYSAAAVRGTEPSDTTTLLNEVEVVAASPSGLRVGSGGEVRLGADALRRAIRMLGDADYINVIKGVGGVTSLGSDYSSGISIDGSQPGQTAYSLNSAPVFFPYHFGGIFSTFSPNAIGSATLTRTVSAPSLADAGAANLDFKTHTDIPSRFAGEVNVGMLAPSLSLRLPIGNKFCVSAGVRYCLLDRLYPWLLKSLQQDVSYNFHDVNTDIVYQPSEKNRLQASFFLNTDRLIMDSDGTTTGLRWGNIATSLSWNRVADDVDQTHTAYFSRSYSSLNMEMLPVEINAPTHIAQGGLTGAFTLHRSRLDLGYTLLYTCARLQNPHVSGISGINPAPPGTYQTSAQASLWGQWKVTAGIWTFRPGIRLGVYCDDKGYSTFLPDPMLSIAARFPSGELTFHASRRHQFTHEVGFTDIGLASNFRLLPSAQFRPLQSINTAIAWAMSPISGLNISIEAFYKNVTNEATYFASIINTLTPGYDCRDYVETGHGFNVGANLTARFVCGPLNATLAYTWSFARRRYSSSGSKWLNAPWAIPHTLNASAAYEFNQHWDVSLSLTFASGRPVTPVRAIYIIDDLLVSEFGERFSSRLPAYRRIDLGATYRFATSHGLSHAINVSIANAAGFKNLEMRYFTVNTKKGIYSLRNVESIVRFLPSISYILNF